MDMSDEKLMAICNLFTYEVTSLLRIVWEAEVNWEF